MEQTPETSSTMENSSPAAQEQTESKGYLVHLDAFEGPLDLLLHLIKKNEVDINEIPIALITKQYLDYIEMMKTLNLEVAGEYLVMAATLAHIKSKSLLPEDPTEAEEDIEEEDPEEALRRRLIEYQRFKEAGGELEERSWLGRDVFVRDEKLPERYSDELKPVSLFSLVELFYKRIKSIPKILEHEVTLERVTISERIQDIAKTLEARHQEQMGFEELLGETKTRYDVIVTFLALLEMVRVSLIRVVQADVFSPIIIQKTGAKMDPTQSQGEDSYAY